MEKWSKEKANSWYDEKAWIRGVSTYPSCCVNRTELWQEYNWEKVRSCIEGEMKSAHEWGFNSIRLIASLEVYIDQHDSYMKHLEEILDICQHYGISVMYCFGNDCVVQKENYSWPKYGPQPCEIGYHSGIQKSPHVSMDGPGYNIIDEPKYEALFYQMIKETVSRYATDQRILVWDMYNEPGNSRRGMMSERYLRKSFEVARSCNPIQPLTAGCWSYDKENHPYKEIELLALELSDVISFHCYLDFAKTKDVVNYLKRYGRPLFVTEWLHRIWHNTVFDLFPYFHQERIACYNWGFITGKSQTREPWGWLWDVYDQGGGRDWDWTKWQHDLAYVNHRPYDPKEYEVIRHECDLADQAKK